jgi:cytochrome P450
MQAGLWVAAAFLALHAGHSACRHALGFMLLLLLLLPDVGAGDAACCQPAVT